jgi:tetratricopeptide (TPR) repeat protein
MTQELGGVQVLPNRASANASLRAADQHFRAAEEALRLGDYERAAAEFTYCIQLAPTRAEAFAKRGDIWRVLGRVDAAVSDFTASLQIHPRNTAVLLSRGQLYALAGRHKPAIVDFSEALEIEPSNAAAYLSRGQCFCRMGEVVPALADFTRSIDLAPGNAFAFVERGSAFLAHGDPSAAVSDLRRAIQLNPFLWLALSKRAEAHLAMGLPEQAAADLSEALRLDPQNAELLAARGAVHLELGKADAALADCSEAVAFNPQDPALRVQRAKAYRALERLDDAENDLTEALRLKPGDPAILFERAEVRLEAKKLDPAFSDFVEVSRRAPQNGLAYRGQALVYIARDDHAMAITCLDRCLEMVPDCTESFIQRARCKMRLYQLDSAFEDASRALDIQADNVPARRLRAEVALRLGKVDEAFADVAQLVNLAPEDPIVYHLRGKLEFRRGRLDSAIQDLSVALKLNPNFTEALADRAGVFRGLGKHREALFDLTTAVQQEPAKYSAEYLVQRGIVHGATGELNRATADFLVALQLDPNNKAAVRGKDLVAQLRESRGPALSESSEFSLDEAAGDRVLSGGRRGRSWRSLIEPDEFAEAKPASRRIRRAALPAPDVSESSVDLTTDPGDTSFEVEGGFDAATAAMDGSNGDLELDDIEQVPAKPKPRVPKPPKPAVTKERSLDETVDDLLKDESDAPRPFAPPPPASALRSNPSAPPLPPPPAPTPSASSFSTPAMPTPSKPAVPLPNPSGIKPAPITKKKMKDAPEERAIRMKKYRRYAIIAVGACFLMYWGVSFAWDLVPQAENPFTEYTADEVVERYTKDSAEADGKFADKRVAIKGRIKIGREKGGKPTGKFYFDTNAAQADMRIELLFNDEDPPRLADGDEVLVNGKAARYKPNVGIQLRDCNIMRNTSAQGPGAWAPAGERQLINGSKLAQNASEAEFHRVRFNPSHELHTRLLEQCRPSALHSGREGVTVAKELSGLPGCALV